MRRSARPLRHREIDASSATHAAWQFESSPSRCRLRWPARSAGTLLQARPDDHEQTVSGLGLTRLGALQ